MNSIQAKVHDFHRIYKVPISDRPIMIPHNRAILRRRLIGEELTEYAIALEKRDIVECADALGDLLYVVFGSAIEHGFDMDTVVAEIHRSNLSKLDRNGQPIFNEYGKVLKGPNFFPPNLAKVLEL